MAFLTEPSPQRGLALPVLPGISRVVAANPGVMTYHGTNTYLVEGADGLTVIDPGPKDEAHIADIIAAAGDRPITTILLTHTHHDHVGALPGLAHATGATVLAYRHSPLAGFAPDIALDDGARAGEFTAIHTPGHAPDHLCFEFYAQDGRKVLFSGDHVMPWSSSIVSPPEGDMLAYYRGLEKMLARDDDLYLSAHGPLLENPRLLVAEMLAHRQKREASIVAALEPGERSVEDLAETLYHKTNPTLRIAAQRNVLAHLLKLRDEGRARELAGAQDDPQPSAVGLYDMAVAMWDARRRFALV